MIPRADVVGSLLRPPYLREARKSASDGKLDPAELRVVEDRAIREAIALQESAGLDAITDGELRRNTWVVTIPLREVGVARAPLAGYEFLPADAGWWSLWKEPDGQRAKVWTAPTRPFVTRRIEVVRDIVVDYAQWHVDADNRAVSESWGHDMAAELVAHAEIDDTVFAGIKGMTRAIHVCRGNAPGGPLAGE